MNRKAVVLINIGTPDKPEVADVRRYLFQFLNDRRVIDLPWLLQKFLVNFIIVPFRAPKSTKLYKLLWQEKGSPLLFYSEQLRDKLKNIMPPEYDVFIAMRYGKPSMKELLNKLENDNYQEITLVPLFPQYASSTTGSLVELALKEISKWYIIPKVKFVNQFYDNSEFIESFAQRVNDIELKSYDHIIFSYHGLPLSQINKSHPKISESECNCTVKMPEHGTYCYKATCYETTRLLAARLNLTSEQFSVAFQSRLTKNWLMPFTDELIESLAKKGCKNILIFAPAFVTDCLETLIELEVEYAELFYNLGGKKLTMVPSLNDTDHWTATLKNIIMNS